MTYFTKMTPAQITKCTELWDKAYGRGTKRKKFTPDAKKHFVVSIVKSMFRILASLLLIGILRGDANIPNLLIVVGFLLTIAEVIGIVEECV
jgi:hypothetical protein